MRKNGFIRKRFIAYELDRRKEDTWKFGNRDFKNSYSRKIGLIKWGNKVNKITKGYVL